MTWIIILNIWHKLLTKTNWFALFLFSCLYGDSENMFARYDPTSEKPELTEFNYGLFSINRMNKMNWLCSVFAPHLVLLHLIYYIVLVLCFRSKLKWGTSKIISSDLWMLNSLIAYKQKKTRVKSSPR